MWRTQGFPWFSEVYNSEKPHMGFFENPVSEKTMDF
jgi:hypothetical protein